MTIATVLIGLALPAVLGWCVIRVLEGHKAVLGHFERCTWAVILGPTVMMLLVFVLHWLHIVQLNLVGFGAPTILAIGVLGFVCHKKGYFKSPAPHIPVDTTPLPKKWKIIFGVLAVWTVMKIFAGTVDLFTVPTYWDDSFNNWNMRGKLFYELKRIELSIPVSSTVSLGEGGVSSYPPTLPMIKTWMSTVRGHWDDGVVNGMQSAWYFGLLLAFYFTLRRLAGKKTVWIGVYALASLPLLLVHGTNPYADVFVASHVFLAITALVLGSKTDDMSALTSWMTLFALAFGLLIFTKNEAMILYAPFLAALAVAIVTQKVKAKKMERQDAIRLLSQSALLAALFIVPWLTYKWAHGLTFGNAKAVGDVMFLYNPDALKAILYHLHSEPNWLLMPLLLPLVILASGKRAWRFPYLVLTSFLVAVLALQFFLFTSVAQLWTEAILQTGFSRGLLHIMPVAVLLTILLAEELLTSSTSGERS